MRLNNKELIWNFFDNFSQQIVNFIVGIILARILQAEDFGLIGIISLIVVLFSTFLDSGISEVLIKKRITDDLDYDTGFWINLTISITIFIALFIFAPLISSFFYNDKLINLIRLISINFILIGLSTIQKTILLRNIDFKKLAKISLISVFLSGCFAIVLALQGWGVYSLIFRILFGQFISSVLLWFTCSWKPNVNFSKDFFKDFLKFGSFLSLSKFLNSLTNNIYYFFMGKFFGMGYLGFYTRAEIFTNLSSVNISQIIQRFSFTVISKSKNYNDKLKTQEYFFKLTAGISAFLLVFLYCNAENIVYILLGKAWISSAIFLKFLSLSSFFVAIYYININLFSVFGMSKFVLKIEIISKMLIFFGILLVTFFSKEFFLYAIIFTSIVNYLISTLAIKYVLKVNITSQFILIFKLLFFSVLYYKLYDIINDYFSVSIYVNLLLNFICISVFLLMFLLNQYSKEKIKF